ncbi:microtubule-associated protein RP/EB family member 1-like [Argonauta hians]
MSSKAITVFPNVRNTGKKDIIDFIRKYINPKLERIEELNTGYDLCFAMFLLFPHSIKVSEVKFGPNLSISARHSNFKRLQNAFNSVGMEKNFPMESMMRGNFQDNFYFGQWFKGFFEANYAGEPYNVHELRQIFFNRHSSKERSAKDIRGGECRVTGDLNPTIKCKRSSTISPVNAQSPQCNSPPPTGVERAVNLLTKSVLVDTLSQTDETQFGIINNIYSCEKEADEQNIVRSDLLYEKEILEKAVEELQNEKQTLSVCYEHSNKEKRYFYEKLREIEKLCLEEPRESLRSSIKTVLYHQGIPL